MTMVGPQRHPMDRRAGANIGLGTKLFAEASATNSPMRSPLNEDSSIDVGYYTHDKSLGEGGFGKVKLATHLKTNQKVAIKMMNKVKLGQDLQRVRIEIEALKVLQHDNIAKLLQVVENKTDIYLVLEYCSGGELFDYLISKKRLTESEVRSIMKDLFRVLQFIHNRGFAHRDLKPENILFDNKHKIKLIDFGLAANSSQNKSNLAFLQTCCGSPAYAAPELLKGQTYSGPAVDVWSAGVLLYSLLVGQLPFDDENIQNLYKKIQVGHFSMPQWLSSDVRDLISSMLKTIPSERISVTKVLDHKWIKRGTMRPSSLTMVSKPVDNEFDEEAFQCCRYLFPHLSEEVLRNKIKDFGYHTSSYLLLRHNDEAKKFVRDSYQKAQNRQQQENCNVNSPRINAIKRKLALDVDSSSNNVTPVVKRTKEVPAYISTPFPFNNGTPVPNRPSNQSNTPRLPTAIHRPTKLTVAVRTPNTPRNPQTPVRMNDKTARRIVSPKMKASNENNCENKVANQLSTPKKDKLAGIKSPLREINNQVISTPVVPQTPISSAKKAPLKAPSTSKKSLLKRIMASATPSKSNTPRKLTNSTQSNNITMTSFQEPQECIDRLVHTLSAKGVECKQKDFSLKCYLNDKIHSSLKFDLEICQFNGLCVIHRKRLKGDAWNYKKICELILQLSNEQQLAALAGGSGFLSGPSSSSAASDDSTPATFFTSTSL